VNKGAKLIAIDPRETEVTRRAELWLRVRPSSDLALALAMINVIINEGLYDKDFVDKWTIGFDKLKTHVQDYPPEKVEEITWVPADLIVKAARLYATNRPGHIEWGNALEHNVNSFQASRAISILMSITGNLGVPGGEIESRGSGYRFGDTESSESGVLGRWSSQLELRDQDTEGEATKQGWSRLEYVTRCALRSSSVRHKVYLGRRPLSYSRRLCSGV